MQLTNQQEVGCVVAQHKPFDINTRLHYPNTCCIAELYRVYVIIRRCPQYNCTQCNYNHRVELYLVNSLCLGIYNISILVGVIILTPTILIDGSMITPDY